MIGLTHDIVKNHYNGKFNVAWNITTYNFYHSYKVKKMASRGLVSKIDRTQQRSYRPSNYSNETYYPLPIKKASF